MAAEGSSFHTALFFILPLLFLVGMAVRNRLWHQRLRRQAAARGWRMTTRGWRKQLRPAYRMAGQTSGGSVWEIERFWRDGRLLIEWHTHARALPYGEVLVVDGRVAQLPERTKAGIPLRSLAPTADEWPERLAVAVTHDHLISFLDRPLVVELLSRFPPAPQPGSFYRLTWRPESLQIWCFFVDDWAVFERIVALGTGLVD